MKILKRLLIIFAALVITLIAALLLVALTVDPNDYKEDIEAVVERTTGHKLDIGGEIKLALFPVLSLDIAQITIDNPPPLKGHLLSAERVSARLKLLPLLQKRLEIGRIILLKPQLMLYTAIDGNKNWESKLSRDATDLDTPRSDFLSSLSVLSLAGISVIEAGMVWRDERTREHIQASRLDLEVGALASRKPAAFSSRGSIRDRLRGFSVGMNIVGAISVEPSLQRISLKNVNAKADFQRDDAPGIGVQVDAGVVFDLAKDTAAFNQLSVAVGDARVDADGASIAGLLSPRQTIDASIRSNTFSLRDLGKALDVALPETGSDRAFQKVAFSGDLTAVIGKQKANATIRKARVLLDDSRLNLQGDVAWLPALQAKFAGEMDRLNVGLYLPPGDNVRSSATFDLPIDDLRVDVNFRNGRMSVPALSANVFGGKVVGDAWVKMRQGKKPSAWYAQGKASSLDMERIIAAFAEEDTLPLRGSGTLSWRLNASGDEAQALLKSLEGAVEVSLEDGKLKHPKLAENIERIAAFFAKRPPGASENVLILDRADASFQIKQGIAENRDLNVDMPLIRLQGEGDIDLNALSVDYQVRAGLRSGAGETGRKIIHVPVRITGTFDDLKYSLDFKKALLQAVPGRLDNVLDKKKKELLKEKKRVIEDTVKDKVDSLLEGIKKLPF